MMQVSREEVRLGSESEFHMLRHFSSVEEGMLANIRGKGHSRREIDDMLNAPGSRFHATFADSIDGLLEILFKYPFRMNEGISGNLELEWGFPMAEYPSGVGTRSVSSMESLSEEQRRSVYILKNRGMDLLHLDVEALPATWDCCLVLKRIKAGFLFITAFPGNPALPLPYAGMEPAALAACSEYWDSHVFLAEKRKG